MPPDPRTPADIDKEFPGWHAWKGVNDAYYAGLRMSSPPVVFTSPTLPGLRAVILDWRRQRYQYLVVPRLAERSSW